MGMFSWLPSFKVFENENEEEEKSIRKSNSLSRTDSGGSESSIEVDDGRRGIIGSVIATSGIQAVSAVAGVGGEEEGGGERGEGDDDKGKRRVEGIRPGVENRTLSSNASQESYDIYGNRPKLQSNLSNQSNSYQQSHLPQESSDTLGPLRRSTTTTTTFKHKLNNASTTSLDPLTDVILQRAHEHPERGEDLSRNLSFMSENSANITHTTTNNSNPVILVTDSQGTVPVTPGSVNSVNSGFFSLLKRSSGRPTSEDELDKSFHDRRDEGWKADVVGYIPNTPVPPKYIHVRAHGKQKKEREFNRLFLAQELKTPTNDYYDSDANVSSRYQDKNAIWCAKFSKDGRFLAAAGEDKVVRVWQVISYPNDREADGTTTRGARSGSAATTSTDSSDSDDRSTFRHHRRKRRERVAYAPVFKSKPIREFYGHTSRVVDVSWSKNNFLLSSSMDKTVRLWHIDRQECLCSFSHSDIVSSISFHPTDDRFFVSGSLDSKLRLWCIPDKEVAFERETPSYITATAFSPDGNTVIAGCLSGQCLFYETERLRKRKEIRVRSTRGRNSKGSKIAGIEVFKVPPQKRYSSRHIQFDSDIKLLISTNDNRIRLYNLYDGTMEIKFKGHQNEQSQINATISDDGKYVITGSEDSRTYIWSMADELYDHANKKKERQDYEYFHSNKSMVTVAIFAPILTKRILATSNDPIYDLCDPPPIELKAVDEEINKSNPQDDPEYPVLRPATKKSTHGTGNIIVTADRSGVIKIFRQDCAYEQRKALTDTSSMQKKRYSGITLSPTHSWRDSFSIHRTKSNKTGGSSSIRNLSPRPFQLPDISTTSERDRGRSRSTSLVQSQNQSRSSSNDNSYYIRPSSSVLVGLNSPIARPISPNKSIDQALRSSSSKLRLDEYYQNGNNNSTTNYNNNSTPNTPSNYDKRSPLPQTQTLAPDDDDTILCTNCGNDQFIAKVIDSEMTLVCSKCSNIYRPN